MISYTKFNRSVARTCFRYEIERAIRKYRAMRKRKSFYSCCCCQAVVVVVHQWFHTLNSIVQSRAHIFDLRCDMEKRGDEKEKILLLLKLLLLLMLLLLLLLFLFLFLLFLLFLLLLSSSWRRRPSMISYITFNRSLPRAYFCYEIERAI